MDNQELPVPLDALVVVTSQQRNTALDRAAQLEVLVQQLIRERDELAAEVERLRGRDGGEAV